MVGRTQELYLQCMTISDTSKAVKFERPSSTNLPLRQGLVDSLVNEVL